MNIRAMDFRTWEGDPGTLGTDIQITLALRAVLLERAGGDTHQSLLSSAAMPGPASQRPQLVVGRKSQGAEMSCGGPRLHFPNVSGPGGLCGPV